MASRASGSTFYDPKDPNNPVTHEARCCFLKIVLDNEPELSQRFAQEVQTLFNDILPEEYRSYRIPDLALWASVYAQADRLEQKHPREALARRELAKEQVERIRFYLPPERHEKGRLARSRQLDAHQVLPVLASFYNETCLRYLDSWALEILLQLAIYCNTQGPTVTVDWKALPLGEPLKVFLEKPSAAESIDHWGYEPTDALVARFGEGFVNVQPWQFETSDHDLVKELLPPKSLAALAHPPEDEELSCRILDLSYRQYVRRYYSREGYRDKPMTRPPPWFYDDETGEYLAYFESIERETPAEAKARLDEAHSKIGQDFQIEREKWARERGLESFQGKRSSKVTPDDHYYWLYLYVVKVWDTDAIAKEAEKIWNAKQMEKKTEKTPDKDKKDILAPDLDDVKKALTATARLVRVDIQDFKKRKKWVEVLKWSNSI